MSHPLFALFADMKNRPVLVVGGGAVAERKIEALLHAGARPRLVARELSTRLRDWEQQGRLAWVAAEFDPDVLEGAWLVVAATDDLPLNRAVADAANARRIFANVVDDAELSSFHVPAVVERGALQVAISSGGGAPMVARHLRRQLETQLDDSWAGLTALFTRQRTRIRERFPDTVQRRRFFETLLAGVLPRLFRQGQHTAAEAHFDNVLEQRALEQHALEQRAFEQRAHEPAAVERDAGSVVLVGAGPGDPGLLTLHALRAMNEADVILHDRLVSDAVLQLARRDALKIEVGKSAQGHSMAQEDIHALMLQHARRGARVVRLKGGDPFVFGRGGEELECLQANGIAFEVVPGITAALACAAYAGIPLTHRDHAQSVRLVTAHCKDSHDTLDWTALAQERQTLAVYMGVAGLENFRARMIAAGRAPTTPFALIENGSRPGQRVITGTLDDLPDTACHHNVQSPALLLLGEVTALASRLHWFGAAPLSAPLAPARPDNIPARMLPHAA